MLSLHVASYGPRLRLYPLKILDEMHFKTPREYLMHFLGRRWMEIWNLRALLRKQSIQEKEKVSRIADLSPFPGQRAQLEEKWGINVAALLHRVQNARD